MVSDRAQEGQGFFGSLEKHNLKVLISGSSTAFGLSIKVLK
jgi:hypothetical protein